MSSEETNDQATVNEVSEEVIADMTDQTLADDGPEDVGLGDNVNGAVSISVLKAQLEAANKRIAEEHDAFLRARADYQNFKRRAEDERDNLRSFVAADLLTNLLPVVDNFERAMNAATQTNDYDKLIGGVNAVYRQLQDFLTKEGVEPIPAVNQPFDPNLHNAVLREEGTDHPEDTVVEELQKGYVLRGRVLRPTMVKVATGG
jgi:molecular chaperone GrpE